MDKHLIIITFLLFCLISCANNNENKENGYGLLSQENQNMQNELSITYEIINEHILIGTCITIKICY